MLGIKTIEELRTWENEGLIPEGTLQAEIDEIVARVLRSIRDGLRNG